MASFKIGTINVNGGGSPLRKIQIKQLVEVNSLDIALLQETHAVRSVQAQWQLFMDKECFFSNNSTSKAGIMFFFLPIDLQTKLLFAVCRQTNCG